MKANIFIHIGFPKTGTTWLQKVVFPAWMKQNGFAFYHLFFLKAVHQKPKKNILISNETITVFNNNLNGLINTLLLFKDAKIIITNREIKSFTESYNNQMILGKKKTVTVTQMKNYQDEVHKYLSDHKISYIDLDIEDFDFLKLARFMNINPPTDHQIIKWKSIRMNTRRPKWVYKVLSVLNKLKKNKLRFLIIYLTDPDKKNKKWYYV